ncbi:MAG: sugar transferase [Lachnospiraceae bacterium]|nr:sugar transferase [Lachnospiraceae bacterium]
MQFNRKQCFYEEWIKRLLDIFCSVLTIVIFSWLYIIIALLVRWKMGSPVIFRQERPGRIDLRTGKEKIFYLYKFRTMTNAKDQNGNLLPDNERLTGFGIWLRRSSMDEIPEVFNILKGDMSVIGPRPQLVRDLVFMSNEQRMRHTVRPGLSGLAQVMGRNAISWEEKLGWDLIYIENISLWNDLKILLLTVKKVFCQGESSDELDVADDYGDYLLKSGKISQEKYNELKEYARTLGVEYLQIGK